MDQEQEKEIVEEKGSSLDLIWDQSVKELDAWGERVSFRDEALLRSAKHLVENLKRSNENTKELVERFIIEQREWEKVACEELLTSTTGLHYLFPVKSYEEINRFLTSYYNSAEQFSNIPIRSLTDVASLERFIESIEQFVEFRQKNLDQFLKNVKGTLEIIHKSQRRVLNLYTKQVKNVFFPFNKYIERSSQMN